MNYVSTWYCLDLLSCLPLDLLNFITTMGQSSRKISRYHKRQLLKTHIFKFANPNFMTRFRNMKTFTVAKVV